MMKHFSFIMSALMLLAAPGLPAQNPGEGARLLKRAEKLHDKIISIDTHTDTALELVKENVDLSKVQGDFAKLREGRVDCCFYPIYMGQGPLTDFSRDSAYLWARGKMEAIRAYIEARPKEASIALTADDIAKNKKRHKLSLVMGLENSYPIGRDIKHVKEFYDLGARIITLSHNYDNDVCDASRYSENTWGGLSPFGKELVKEMNRLGIIVDCSHAATSTLYDCLELSTAPVICSHSCVYAIKDHPRNLTDDEIRAIAAKGGVVQVTTGRWALSWLPHAQVNISTFCDHVEYIRNLVGVEYVGIGTDFDGGGGMNELEDASKMKYITVELMRRGWTDHELELFWGGNLLRVMRAVEAAAAETGGPDRILPCPAQVTIAAASIPCSEAEVKIGSKAFKKATSGLPDFARNEAAIRCSAARSSTIRALHIAASCSTFPGTSATRISSSSRSKQWNAEGKHYAERGEAGAYGGYLSQEDAREIVAYAAKRNITVIPEIEMPGHSAEVLAAYPELSCLSPASVKDWSRFHERALRYIEYLNEKGYRSFDLKNEFGERMASLAPLRHLAVGKRVSYALPWHKSYPAAAMSATTPPEAMPGSSSTK